MPEQVESRGVLNSRQAYEAMIEYLCQFYRLTNSDDIGGLLGSMQLSDDGFSVDPAIAGEWNAIVRDILANKKWATSEN